MSSLVGEDDSRAAFETNSLKEFRSSGVSEDISGIAEPGDDNLVPEEAETLASVETFVDGNFVYEINADLTSATLVECVNPPSGNVVIPEAARANGRSYSVTGIDGAFQFSTDIRSVFIPDPVEVIKGYSFNGCESLSSVRFPSGSFKIGSGCFKDCTSLTSITIPKGLYTGNRDDLNSVPSVGPFEGSGLSSVTFEQGIENIQPALFENCPKLQSVSIPDTVKVIGPSSFVDCKALASVSIPDSVETISSAFFGCSALTSVFIPDSVKLIEGSFGSCENLSSVRFPSGIFKLGSYSFTDCTSLTSITIPKGLYTGNRDDLNSVPSVGPFEGSGLSSVTFEQGIENIQPALFENCPKLQSVSIPDTVKVIGSRAFVDCKALTSASIPSSVETIMASAFFGCSALASVSIPDSVKTIDGATFYGCEKLSKVMLGKGMTNVPDSMFSYCRSLSEVTLPESICEIEEDAFSFCTGLSKVYIPAKTTKIDQSAFRKAANFTIAGLTYSYAQQFAESQSIPFESVGILKYDLKNATVTSVGDQLYAGSPIRPTITVIYDGKTLVEDVDYSLSYANNINVGTATISIGGKGAFTGTKTVSFKIVKLSIGDVVVSAIPYQTYTGSAIKPDVHVSYKGKTLKDGVDYSITYKNNVSVGTATVIITGKGTYTGSKTASFKIAPKPISKVDMKSVTVLPIVDQVYTGKLILPVVIVSYNDVKLEKDIDYTISYESNKNVGTGRIVITGKGKYEGSKTVLFNIVKPSAPRLAGDTALDTMTSITKQGFKKGTCDTVIVATMNGYWDALTASALAGINGCPILLTDGGYLSAQTSSEITRLGATKVYVTGGTAAISKSVETSLSKISGVKSVKRLAGDIAVNTALEVYKEGKGSWSKTAIVATSETFQDALSASPYSYAKKAPIFLANASTHKLDPQVLSAVKQGGFNRVVIVGGTAALSSEIENEQLKGIACKRLAGSTAYETSGAIASWCLTQGMEAYEVGIATGASYYDALAGAALCGKNNAALILVADENRSTIDGFMSKHSTTITKAYVFGGPAAISAGTYKAIQSKLA